MSRDPRGTLAQCAETMREPCRTLTLRYAAGDDRWLPVTEEHYMESLEVLFPLAMGRDWFVMREPLTHAEGGYPVCEVYRRRGTRHEARTMSLRYVSRVIPGFNLRAAMEELG